MSSLGTIIGRIILNYDGRGAERAREDVDGLQRSAGGTRGVLKKLAGIGVFATIGGGIKAALSGAADFEQKLSAVAAVSGASSSQMESLRNKALQLGKDTSFGASEAANAIEELAKSGLSTESILGGAADATVALAAAGGLALPKAAEISTNAMSQFNMSASDLPKVADLIAGAANASAMSVGDFGMALSQSGATASTIGLSFGDLSVAIAEMANSGIKGSDAGTSLKNFLMRLQPTTKASSNAMKELGLITEDGSNKFLDASGKLKPLGEIQGLLNDSLKEYSPAAKAAALQTIFGSDAMRAAAVLSNEGSKGFDKMATSMGKMKAADVAKTRMSNLKGSMEELSGTIETIGITIGSALLPGIKAAVDGLVNILNGGLSKIPEMLSRLANSRFAGVLMAGFASLGGAVMNIIGIVKDLYTVFKPILGPIIKVALMGIAIAFRMAANVIRTITRVIKRVTGAMARFATPIQSVIVAIMTFAGIVAAVIFGPMLAANAAFAALGLAILGVMKIVRMFAAVFRIISAVMALNPLMLGVIAAIAFAAAMVYAYKHSERFRNIVNAAWRGVKAAARATASWVKNVAVPWLVNAWGVISRNAVKLWQTIVRVWRVIVTAISNAISRITSIFHGAGGGWRGVIAVIWAGIVAYFKFYLAYLKTVVGLAWRGLVALTKLILRGMKLAVIAVLRGLRSLFINTLAGLIAAAIVLWWALKNGVILAVRAIKTGAIAAWNGLKSGTLAVIRGIKNGAIAAWNGLKNGTIAAVQAIKSGAVAAWNGLKTAVVAVVNGLKAAVTAGFNALRAVVSAVMNAIKSVVGVAFRGLMNLARPAINAMRTHVITGFNAMKLAVRSVMNAIKIAITAAWQIIKNNVRAAMQIIKALVTGNWRAIPGIIRGAMSQAKAIAVQAWNAIKAHIRVAMSAIKVAVRAGWNAIRAGVQASLNSIKNATVRIWNSIKAAVVRAIQAIKARAIAGFRAMASAIKGALARIKSSITNGFNRAKSAAVNAVRTMKSQAISAFRQMVSGIRSGMSQAVSAVRNGASRIKAVFSGAGSWLVSAGRSLVRGLANGIQGAMGEALSKARAMADRVKSVVKGAFDINSPSRFTIGIGKSVVEGLSVGLEKNQRYAAGSALTVADTVKKSLLLVPEPIYLGAGNIYQSPGQPRSITTNNTSNGPLIGELTLNEVDNGERVFSELSRELKHRRHAIRSL